MDSDTALLQHFTHTLDESAFGKIVARHAPMVQGVALRATGDQAMAADIAQMVFAILARKAHTLGHEALAGWLHRTAFLEARNARRKTERYRKALHQYQEQTMAHNVANHAGQENIAPHLDLALTKLPAADRQLVVLRYYEDQNVREIALAAGITEDACRKRLLRALERLAAILRRRGLSPTAQGLAAILAGGNFCAAPASAATLTAGALQAASSLTTTSFFYHSILIMKTSTKLKTIAAVSILASLPMAMLWNNESRKQARNAAPPLLPVARPSAQAQQNPDAPGLLATETVPAGADTPAASVPSVPDATRKMMIEVLMGSTEEQAIRDLNRLSLNLPSLTEGQKVQLKAIIDEKVRARRTGLESFVSSINPGKVMESFSFSEEEKAKVAALKLGPYEKFLDEATLESVLTKEQYRQHSIAREARRVAEAEDAASGILKSVGEYVDLTGEQKDHLFQQLAAIELNPGPPAEAAAHPDPQDGIIRSILTPEQAAVYDKALARKKQDLEKMLEMLDKDDPGTPEAKPSAGDQNSDDVR